MASPQKRSFFRYENGVVLMMFFTFGFVFMERLSIVYLFPFIAPDLKLSNAEIGMIASVLAVCWAVSGFIFGSISDLVGSRKKVLLPITLAFSLFSFLSGLARSFWQMILVRGLMGVSEGPVLPLAQASVIAASTPERRGFNLGFVQSSLGLVGSFLTPIIVTQIAVHYSWHEAFYLVGVPGLVMFFVLLKWMREPGRGTAQEAEAVEHTKVRLADIGAVFRHRNMWFCVLIAIFSMTWLFAFTTFAPTFLTAVSHYSPDEMGLIMSAVGLGTFVWGFVGPAISDRLGRKPTLILFAFVACLSPICLALLRAPVGVMMMVAFLTTVGQAVFPLFLVIIPGESLPYRLVASAVGLTQFIGELVGGTFAPWLGGVAADHWGLVAPMWIAAAGMLVSALLAFGLKETAPAKIGRRALEAQEIVPTA
ncbi:MFS transporter [Thermogemmatispora tikiterensis]|uniref:MFS transporter n=1 Tax=Thermogemmatispora tikiterensis TaxID=1825093 RepID=A0A328VAX2_9CHLR|nr:MFS transporter [Thermogemmatispora tikiterensis]RAQ94846.1 MFS transporter [Thermogemmatispora tikiterensis]